ncbi:MAG: OmpA family protein [Acetobacteraceae bacterium]
MRSRAALIAALIAAPFATASAQPIQGLYVSAGAGLNIPQSVHATVVAPGFSSGSLRLNQNLGYGLTGSIGYALGGGARFEVEGDYINDGVKGSQTAGNGHVRTTGVMANALYDFDIRSRYVFPYLGVGAGYMWTRLDNAVFVEQGGGNAVGTATNVNSGKFAWQFIAGAAFPIPNTPGLSLTAQYRLLDVTGGERFTGSGGSLELGPQFTHTLTIGLRYAFNVTPPAAPAPTPVAAPAPAPARSYLVFFDWDKATLTDRARQIVREAAEASTHVHYTQLRVNGYTDTSGSAAYNQALSMRRADNVAAELVRDGVPRAAIAIRGFGETHLLVPTGPGVREPQNRRVEIIIG